mgnify:FL=1
MCRDIELGISAELSKQTLLPRSPLTPVQLHVFPKYPRYTLIIKKTHRLSDLDLFGGKNTYTRKKKVISIYKSLLLLKLTFFYLPYLSESFSSLSFLEIPSCF